MLRDGETALAAIVLAAGRGSRMASAEKKQFMEIGGRPLFLHSVEAFASAGASVIAVVTGEEDVDRVNGLLKNFAAGKSGEAWPEIAVAPGGAERWLSVREGLEMLRRMHFPQEGIVAIHDGARPVVDSALILRTVTAAEKYGSGVAGVPSKDTIRVTDAEGVSLKTPDRNNCWLVQTPQTFRFGEIASAYEKVFAEQALQAGITDDAMLFERATGKKTRMVMGDYRNIKVTTPEDREIVETFLEQGSRRT